MFASQLLCMLHAGKRFMANGADVSIIIVFTFIANLNFWQPIHCFKKTIRYFLILLQRILESKANGENSDYFRAEMKVIGIVLYMLFYLTPCKSGIPNNLSLGGIIVWLTEISYGSNNYDIFWKCKCCKIVFTQTLLIFTFMAPNNVSMKVL